MISRTRTTIVTLLFSSIVFLSFPPTIPAHELDTDKETPVWKAYCDLATKSHDVQIRDEPKRKIVRTKQPVFVHTIQVGVEGHGIVYVWTTEAGQPVAVVSCIVNRQPGNTQWDEINEFHSLHDEPIIVKRDGAILWQPPVPGLLWTEFPEAPAPANSAVRQLRQAKQLSRGFTARGVYHRLDGSEWKLRLIPTPLHKCTDKQQGQPTTGCLFAFCRANDPEALLSIAVRKNSQGKLRWHYACANFSDAGVTVKLDSDEVWSEDPARFARNYQHWGYAPNQGFDLDAALQKLRRSAKDR